MHTKFAPSSEYRWKTRVDVTFDGRGGGEEGQSTSTHSFGARLRSGKLGGGKGQRKNRSNPIQKW